MIDFIIPVLRKWLENYYGK